ncbi:hypothetical protein O7632_25775 [Solwaraspora sp. WMMD406]|uniref:hypothetical protein n=1 Tax=Solwaraspora sp. WMMD406 TaxID=3016095 RepID=UPI002416DD26|nr:hypothetical protein [Solwaraspora sp. WMMD406]MDG4767474.1 hypothetical protein [Solwaraspora sp. WMMD406]
MKFPWDLADPPAKPPPGCRDGQRWRTARTLYGEHVLEDTGAHCRCGELWPCPTHRRAIRALATAYLQAGPVMVGASTAHDVCRWCARTIVSHPDHGWIHPYDGYVTCDPPHPDVSPAATAEPAPTTR